MDPRLWRQKHVIASVGYVCPMPFHDVAFRLLTPEAARPDFLSPEERVRLESFGSAERKTSFLLGRTAARILLAQALGCQPPAAPLAVGDDGAPRIKGSPLYISIAHAGRGDVVGGAAVGLVPLGLDLERILPRQPGLWRRILSPEEYGVLDALGGPSDAAQTLLWSLKEAVLKGRRTGLRAGMRSVTLRDLSLARGQGVAADADGGLWRIGFRREGDVWVSLALAQTENGPALREDRAAGLAPEAPNLLRSSGRG